MLQALVRRIVGSRNQREVKRYFKSVGRINALAPQFEALTDAQLRQWTDTLKQRHARRRDAGPAAAGSLRPGARGGRPGARHAPFRRAAGRRHGAARGQDRRDAHRRGQDPGRHAAGLPERARRQGRARGHRERLPGPPRWRLDGPGVRVPGPDAPASSCRTWTRRRVRPPTPPTSPTAPTTSSVSTTCATTWPSRLPTACSAEATASSTKWTRSSSTRRARR